MLSYIARRMLVGLLTIWIIISLVFVFLRLIPGNPAEVWLGDYATPELIKMTQAKWGLDKPLYVQYYTYLKNIVHGDLGKSLRMKFPVIKLLVRHYPFTLRLVFLGTIISILIAIPLGIAAAVHQNSYIDMIVMMFSFLFISMPAFWLGLIVLFTFSFRFGWFPSIGGESGGSLLNYLSYLALPSICIGLRQAGLISRMVRSTMIDTLNKEFIMVVRSKGLSEKVIHYKHALRNAMAPIISLIGVTLVLSLAGAVVLEVVYSRPGLGRLYVNAVAARDYPLIQGCILTIAIAVVVVNILVDISYGIIDPRIRYD